MQKIKNQNGITMVVLIITIIVLLILIGTSLNSGMFSIEENMNRSIQAELQMIQQVAIQEYSKAKQLGYLNKNETPINFVGTIVNNISKKYPDINWEIMEEPAEKYKAYYELKPEDLEKLGIKYTEDTYIVNYYTGEVYNATQKETSSGIKLYIKSGKNSDKNKQEDVNSFNDWVD